MISAIFSLQCCPPRRAGVGQRLNGSAERRTRFNAARPEGRESGSLTVDIEPFFSVLQCCPPRRAGVGRERRVGWRVAFGASMLPAPKGGSRVLRASGTFPSTPRFNAARPEGRESGPPVWTPHCSTRSGFNAARPEGRESAGTAVLSVLTSSSCFNAARPEGRESVAGADVDHVSGRASMLPAPKGGSREALARLIAEGHVLQCCPPRRAGVGPPRRVDRVQDGPRFNAARPEGRESGNVTREPELRFLPLQCCPPRRAGVGRRSRPAPTT